MHSEHLPQTAARQRIFWHPEPAPRPVPPVFPVFLPQAGCPRKCIFCDQSAQTGARAASLDQAALRLDQALTRRRRLQAPAVELAFYGGTFTALPGSWTQRFLDLAASHIRSGSVARLRCSTRPDAVSPALLRSLRDAGMNMVELGVQTFAPHALHLSNRGYAPFVAQNACGQVRDAGLELGVQLLPGAPGQQPGDFQEDLRRTAAQAPDMVRLYPCLVLAQAPLARLWREGRYEPWSLEQAVEQLGRALLLLWRARIRVGRVGVAQEPALAGQVMAGAYHPSLGAMARAQALFWLVEGEIKRFLAQDARPLGGLMAPKRYQGEFFGHKGGLKQAYAALGLASDAARFWDKSYFSLF